jgi:hypothetical protein
MSDEAERKEEYVRAADELGRRIALAESELIDMKRAVNTLLFLCDLPPRYEITTHKAEG